MEGTNSDYHMLEAALGHASGRQLRGTGPRRVKRCGHLADGFGSGGGHAVIRRPDMVATRNQSFASDE